MIASQEDLRVTRYPENLSYQLKTYEKIPVELFHNAEHGSKHIAQLMSFAIRAHQRKGEKIVLGLATGSSPIHIYKELIRMHREENLSFSNVITFNLDEYYPMNPDEMQSYHKFMHEYLFDHIDIPPENINIPDGTIPMNEIADYCEQYERKIQLFGGIDIQLLGIGRTGHIGFNEPGSNADTETRLVRLDNITRTDASGDFNGLENVPYKAITMGVRSIMSAKEICIFAWGLHKAPIVKRALEGPISNLVSATFLQQHPNVKFYLDTAAASRLTRVETPWKVGSCVWDENLIAKAVIWLSQKLDTPILKLTEEDYNENGLSELILEVDSAYQLNINVFNRLQHTITGWPGGKPNHDDTYRPERSAPAKKRVLIFSPHPDDDVISMGGTLLRLVEQGHDVHVAYQTSGNIAVHDHDVIRYLEFHTELLNREPGGSDAIKKNNALIKFLRGNSSNKNTNEVRVLKGLIRKAEATGAARFCGIKDQNIHFLNLPFYESGRVKKFGISESDIEITKNILMHVKPHQVFAAGDLADPHDTHRVCLDAILRSLDELKSEKWIKNCWLWLYRGAWEDFAIDEIEMAVPLSPKELLKKRNAIFMHQSQKDKAPFPGSDEREFWQRSEARNRNTAIQYRKLGLAEYEAMEAFKRWVF
ncbi:MAG: glucosamine-6-phosphate deaminase [Bacteroidota bacterium]